MTLIDRPHRILKIERPKYFHISGMLETLIGTHIKIIEPKSNMAISVLDGKRQMYKIGLHNITMFSCLVFVLYNVTVRQIDESAIGLFLMVNLY